MSRQGILVVISGFSGAGKGTLIKELMKRYDQVCTVCVGHNPSAKAG